MGQYTNGVHVVFIPFNNCEEEVEAVENWNTYNSEIGESKGKGRYDLVGEWKLKRKFEAVSGDAAKIPDHLAFSSSPNNVMYILGHCESGASSMSATSGGESIDGPALAKRVSDLIGDPNFAGGIKVYGCDTGSHFLISLSFAHRFAEALIDKYHYKSCTIYGYTACVSNYQPRSFYDLPSGVTTKFNKVIGLDATYLKGVFLDLVSSSPTQLRRAKEAQLVVARNGKIVGK